MRPNKEVQSRKDAAISSRNVLSNAGYKEACELTLLANGPVNRNLIAESRKEIAECHRL
ncbi:hypothetical protein BC835DRAFT_1335177 [Cytidiella melzeri]|nr:hypothetical protein BC835DRAFT_1335177 [Cytidiella melzeri]